MRFNDKIFEYWIKNNYVFLTNSLKSKNIYNEDIFHDALITILKNKEFLKFNSISLLDSFFKKVYKSLFIRYKYDSLKYIHPDLAALEIIIMKEYEEEDISDYDYTYLSNKIINKVKYYFPEDFELFKLYFLNSSVSLRDVSLYYGMSISTISRKIKKIKTTILNITNHEFRNL